MTLPLVSPPLTRIGLIGECMVELRSQADGQLGQAFGGEVVRAREPMHGKTSPVYHNGEGVFAGLPNPFTVTRYHSLVVKRETLPECLEITAWTQHPDGSMDEIMGLRHREFMIEGVQFHPESILTEHGHDLLANFLQQQGGRR